MEEVEIRDIDSHRKKLRVPFSSTNYLGVKGNPFSFIQEIDETFREHLYNLVGAKREVGSYVKVKSDLVGYVVPGIHSIQDYERLYSCAKYAKEHGKFLGFIFFRGENPDASLCGCIKGLEERCLEGYKKGDGTQFLMLVDRKSGDLRGAIEMNMEASRTTLYVYENEFVCQQGKNVGGEGK